MKYLKVNIEGCHHDCGDVQYTALDPLTKYTEVDLVAIGQDMVNEHFGGFGVEEIDEADVPEGER